MDNLMFDNTQAQSEGWFISWCDGYVDEAGKPRPWQLQREDETGVFDGDQEAWTFVGMRAALGSPYHVSAMEFLRQHSPPEYAAIMKAGWVWKAEPAEMKSYRVLIQRKVTMIVNTVIEAESEDDLRVRFEHLCENDSDFGISEEEWGEAYYYQVVKAGLSSGEFEMLEYEEVRSDYDEKGNWIGPVANENGWTP